eukprot:6380386-Prymnesium_polylepis.1
MRWQRGGLLRGDGFAMVERACCVQSLRLGKQGIRCGSLNPSREGVGVAASGELLEAGMKVVAHLCLEA